MVTGWYTVVGNGGKTAGGERGKREDIVVPEQGKMCYIYTTCHRQVLVCGGDAIRVLGLTKVLNGHRILCQQVKQTESSRGMVQRETGNGQDLATRWLAQRDRGPPEGRSISRPVGQSVTRR